MSFRYCFWLLGVGMGMIHFSLQAQDYEKIAPKTLEKKGGGEIKIPQVTPLALDDKGDRVLVGTLRGLVLVSSPDQINKNGVFGVEGLKVDGLDSMEEKKFYEWIKESFGKPVTFKSLGRLTRAIILFYRNRDRPIVDVVVPEQEITGGVIQMIVFEGKLGEIRVEDNRWFSTNRIANLIRFRTGETLVGLRLTEDVNWINNNPFRHANAILSPGKNRGATDLILKVQDRFPVRFYGGFENSGNDLTGDERLPLGFNWGNAFWLDHQMNYQFTSDSAFNKLVAHSGSYVIPLPWRHRLNFFGSYAESKADIANPLFALKGESWQVSSRYTVPLPAFGSYSHETTAGFDFKSSNNNLEFGGAQVFNTTTEIAQWVFDYNGVLKDEWGRTGFNTMMAYGPGKWTERNTDIFFNASRRSAFAEYVYGKLTLERMTKLPGDFTWTVKGVRQWANGNLLGSEQLGLGGYSTVRGYDEREANGDEGYLISTEVRTPSVSLGKLMEWDKAVDQLQFLGFFDYGATENRVLLPGEDPHLQLAGAGPGVRYEISPWLSFRFDYGFQLYYTGLNTRYNSRAHTGIVLSY